MAIEKLKFLSAGEVQTATSEEDIEEVIGGEVYDMISTIKGRVRVDDAKLAVTKAGSGKQLWVDSDGTWVGTTVKTADGVTTFDNLKSVTIRLDSSGLKVAVRCDPIEVDLSNVSQGVIMSKVTKAVTFSNTTGTVDLFTVTGDVQIKLLAVAKTTCASVADCNAQVGIAGDLDAILPDTDITLLAAEEIWNDTFPSSEIEAMGESSRDYDISDGNDIIMTLSAQADSGAITFYCFWTPLSANGNVVAA